NAERPSQRGAQLPAAGIGPDVPSCQVISGDAEPKQVPKAGRRRGLWASGFVIRGPRPQQAAPSPSRPKLTATLTATPVDRGGFRCRNWLLQVALSRSGWMPMDIGIITF